MRKFETVKFVQIALLCSIAIALVIFIRIPIIPLVPFLEYDMADVPVLIGALLFGPVSGFAVLFIVSLVQAFLLGGNGWVGFIMHFLSSGAMLSGLAVLYRRAKSFKYIALGLIAGGIGMVLIMIPLNYIFTVNFYGLPKEVLDSLLWPGIIPFNMIKAVLNIILTLTVYKAMLPFIKRKGNIK